MRNIIKENIIKNFLIILIGALSYHQISEIVLTISPQHYGTILSFISLTLLASLFGVFSFTYEKSKMKSTSNRYLSHLTTGLLMLCSLILLETSLLIINSLIGRYFLFEAITVLVYISIVCYDFWDLLRMN